MEYKNIVRKSDGSFLIDRCGGAYHIPKAWPEWAYVNAYAEAHPEEVAIEYPPEPYEPTFAELVKSKRREIWGAGDAILAAVKANFTEAEIESWSKQEQGAKDIQAGNTDTDSAKFVAGIAAQRGMATETLVAKIMGHVETYAALSATVIGEQQRLDDMIKTATTQEQLDAIVWTLDPFAEEE